MCVAEVSAAIEEVEGVVDAEVDFDGALVVYDAAVTDADALVAAVEGTDREVTCAEDR